MSDQNKGSPPLRIWELQENSTRYDIIAAAPSDQELTAYWTAWSAVAFSVGLFTITVFLGIVSSRQTRRNSFNLYLIYLMVPDFTFAIFCGINCLLNAIKGAYWSTWMCNFQAWYVIYGIGANAWLNAIVTYQLHTMLRLSSRGRRYKPPTRQRITQQALVVYLYTSALGLIGMVENDNFPIVTGPQRGLGCIPLEVDRRTTFFYWVCFFPAFVGFPLLYIIYVTFDVFRNQLLPPNGKRRTLVVFFCRLIGVFIVMWIPTFVMIFSSANWISVPVVFAGGIWSHLQGAVSAGVSLLKPDIYQAVRRLLLCQCSCEEDDNDPRRMTSNISEMSLSRWSSSQPNQQRLPVFQTRLSGFSEEFSTPQSETSLATCCEYDEQSPGPGLEPIVDNETEEVEDGDDDSFTENT